MSQIENILQAPQIRDQDADGTPVGSVTITFRDQMIRALNLFVGFIAKVVANGSGFSDAETAGFRNLMRACAREGGKNVKGYYSVIPAEGKCPKVEVDGEMRATVTRSQVESAFDAATKVTSRLLEVLSTKVEQKSRYAHDGRQTEIKIPVGQIDELPTPEIYVAEWERACAQATQPGGFYVEEF